MHSADSERRTQKRQTFRDECLHRDENLSLEDIDGDCGGAKATSASRKRTEDWV